MKRCFFVLAGVTLLASLSSAIDVAEDEVRKAPAVDFINYDGPRELQFDADQVRDIGRFLEAELARGGGQARYARKYSAIHVFDPAMLPRLGADIIVLEPGALADHINTIRYVLAGFLEAGYRYTAADAALLAVFVTYYNAAHRGDIPYFNGVYQPGVLSSITAANAGLARSYLEWAGASRILIPLTERAAARAPGALDTSALTDKRVTEELQKREDRGVPERKGMVELKEREAGQAEKEAAAQRAAVERQKQAIASEQKALDEQKKAAADAQAAAEQDRRRAAQTADAAGRARREQEAAAKAAEAAAAQKELAARQQQLEQKKAEAAQGEAAAAKAEAKVEEKKAEIAQEKAEVKRDERIVEAQKNPEKIVSELEAKEQELANVGQPVAKNRLYYLKVTNYLNDGHYANELFAIDALTGELLYKAPERPDIAGHQYIVVSDGPDKGVVVLTYQGGDNREAHFLTLLDLDTLKPTKVGSNSIFHRSFVEKRGDFFYAVELKGGDDYRLGKYDAELRQVAESADRIDPDTVFHIYGDLIFVNSASKKVLVLKAADLSKVRELALP